MPLQQTWRYLPAQLIALATQLFSLLLWLRLLSLGEVGRLTLIIAAQEILFALTLSGWSHYMLRFRARLDPVQFRQTEKGVLAGTLLLQALVVCAAMLFIFGAENSGSLGGAAIAFVIVRSLSTYMAECARADDDSFAYTCLQALFPAMALLLAIIAIVHVAASAQSVLWALALAHGAGALVIAIRTGFGRARLRLDARILKSAMAFGLPMSLATLAAASALNAPRFLVEHELGIAAAGLFAVVYGLGLRVASGAVMLVSAGAYPLAVRKTEANGIQAGHRQLAVNFELLALILFPAVFGFIAITPSFVLLLLPSTLQATAGAMLPLAALFGLLRYLRSHSTDQVFLLHGRSGVTVGLAVLELTLVVFLSAVGISIWGLTGALVGAVVAAAICFGISVVVARKRFEFVFPAWPVLRCASAASGMVLVLRLFPVAETFPALAVSIVVGAGLYCLCLLALYFPWLGWASLQDRFRGEPHW